MSSFSQAEFLISANRPAQFPPDKGSEVAFAGRSNAGKSSALNAIAGRKSLARISKTPGRTQLVNFFALPDGDRLVDLPGYGYARVPEAVRRHWRHLVEAYFYQRRSLAGLILVMDVRRPLTEFDRQMLAWSEGVGCLTHILLTKADKFSRGKASAMLNEVRSAVDAETSVQLFSATKKTGVDQAREALLALMNRQPAGSANDRQKNPRGKTAPGK
ncbi:MAG: ribosome biogenesis GTP-binding protein YihA/YsxC [Gammaproteobacteria bacterium]|nr:ribosome biogenesis GTP-binding protein YihA/YsxC [Gammaproteobacteria bacterium]MCZ6717102.1 ribosome biogenesis GTP-binding protein YihA/YsxC [Gammaproteobacteria bacterium]MCZ6827415.1 ribosome biogenesis GTP-binding protein YihA/YsxC [Gammaproteobacteria bacterium]MCZ6911291.1 ribosome biogenesis GTP-binding protein YihA/YsxC [Pseudomonadota bacterium]